MRPSALNPFHHSVTTTMDGYPRFVSSSATVEVAPINGVVDGRAV
jgi:hypothetical protein